MADHLIADSTFINSIVGEGTKFKGDLELNGLLRIDGDYSGTIYTPGKILVGKNGRARCTIKAGTVVVGGVVRGNIFATEKVIVLSTGMIIGNVSTPRLVVEEGVILNGKYIVNRDNPEVIKLSKEHFPGLVMEEEKEAVSPTDNPGEKHKDTEIANTHLQNKGNGDDLESRQDKEELSAWKG
ncbi:MAG: hypothetical protein DRP87_04965 [Spirochaetes bacterium]|nr:MAG: hypothetical protein DRP87_04965 [Spirochaetota bacterium]